MMNKICDAFIIAAAISLILGIIVRLTLNPFIYGITAQAYLQFSHGLLLFAIAIGIRELLRAKSKQ
ncbi:MAG: hypothetical protein ACE5WD_10325 [Candidatus Aminicenantia bacterium]